MSSLPRLTPRVIEIGGSTAGIVVADHGGRLVFHSAGRRFDRLDRRFFATIADAERAVRELLDRSDSRCSAEAQQRTAKVRSAGPDGRADLIPSVPGSFLLPA